MKSQDFGRAKKRNKAFALVFSVLLSISWAGSAAATTDFDQYLVDAADWLLPFQLPSGAFPFSESDQAVFPNVQAAPGMGMLTAYKASCRLGACNQAFLQSAIDNADYLINGGFGNFSPNTGFPRIRAGDPIFFILLSAETGDPQYADFIQTFFWGRLSAGIYGPQNNWGIVQYVDSELARRGAQAGTGEVVAPWDLAFIAWAADEAGITQFNAALAEGARIGLSFATDTDAGRPYVLGSSAYDVVGLAGAVWIGGLTGLDVAPASGPWSNIPFGNFGLGNLLVSFQSDEGGWLQSSAAGVSPIDVRDTVSQNTAFAIRALQSLRRAAYCDSIDRGLNALVDVFQEANGRISYFHPTVDLNTVPNPEQFIFTHAYAMIPFFMDRPECEPPVAVPVNDWRMLSLLIMLMLALGCAGLALRRA